MEQRAIAIIVTPAAGQIAVTKTIEVEINLALILPRVQHVSRLIWSRLAHAIEGPKDPAGEIFYELGSEEGT